MKKKSEQKKKDKKLELYQKVGILLLSFVIAGFVGWLYEFLLGWGTTGYPYLKGGNLLPWINIYAFGAMIVIFLTYKIRKYPWAVFLISFFATGFLELVGGWLVYTLGNGTRYWYYNEGPWAFGNINGFVCLLSVTIFGIFSLILMYLVFPFLLKLARKMTRKAFLTLAISLFALIMLDEVANLALRSLGAPSAMEFYQSIGAKYDSVD